MTDAQADLFGPPDPPAPSPVYRADPDEVRARLSRILAEARAAESPPWDRRRTALDRTIVPQMTLWLPEDEAAGIRAAFAAELARLTGA